MSGIIDLNELRKGKREVRQAREEREKRSRSEFIQVATTTITMALKIINHMMSLKPDEEFFEYLVNACNYQLTCFARAYGLLIDKKIPASLEVQMQVVDDEKKVAIDFWVNGDLGDKVMQQISLHNADNPNLVPCDEEGNPI